MEMLLFFIENFLIENSGKFLIILLNGRENLVVNHDIKL